MVNVLACFSAGNRLNYGDILFPVIFEWFRNKYLGSEWKYKNYAISGSDLSEYGGIATEPISALRKERGDYIHVVIAGGDVIAIDCDTLANHESGLRGNFHRLTGLLGRACRKAGLIDYQSYKSTMSGLANFLYGLNSDCPFLIAGDQSLKCRTVSYFASGGILMSRGRPDLARAFSEVMSEASYASVRDNTIAEIINGFDCSSRDLQVSPDSAAVMRRVFNAPIRKAGQISEPYICFQCNYGWWKRNKEEAVHSLEKISAKTGHRIALLPIGWAPGHSDYVALRDAKKTIGQRSMLIRDKHIDDVRSYIAGASLFVGTSLHGAITSMAYSVPHVGLKGPEKLEAYLATWDVGSQNKCYEASDIYIAAENSWKIDQALLTHNANRLEKLVLDNFDSLAESLLLAK